MNFKKLFIAVTMTVALASCNNSAAPSTGKLLSDIKDFLETRQVTIESIPYIDSVADTSVLYSESFEGDSEYVPNFYFVLEGDVVEPSLTALKAADWTVPTQETEYGYECSNKEKTVEIDIFYSDKDDAGNGVRIGTNYYVYACSDLSGGTDSGDDSGDYGDDDWDDPASEAVALEIATNIYGAEQAENNIGWLFAYYVESIVDGTDLKAAVRQHIQYLPQGFEMIGEITEETETDDEGTYTFGYAGFMNDDLVVIEICSYLDEETAGKIDVYIYVYSFEEIDDTGDDSGEGTPSSFDFSVLVDAKETKTDAQATSNVVNNNDGSKTVTLDFTSMENQATICKQTVGDLSVKVKMGDNTNNKPAYFTKNTALRIYWGTALEFSVPQGQSIVKVEFDSVQSKADTILVDKSNLAIKGGSYTVSDNHVTINADENVNALVMALDIGKTGHIALSNISITYK